jgi:hypothetical protein
MFWFSTASEEFNHRLSSSCGLFPALDVGAGLWNAVLAASNALVK